MAALASSSTAISSKTAVSGVSVPRNGPFTSRTAAPRQMMVKAQQGPNEVAMRTFGALAAAQLALLPLSGAAIADLLPDSASQSGKAAINKATDNAPSLKDVGKALTNFEGARDKAPDVEAAGKDVQKQANKGRDAAQKAADKVTSSNPAQDFANRVKEGISTNPVGNGLTIGSVGTPNPVAAAKSAAKKAQAVGVPDPAAALADKTKSAVKEAKAIAGKNGVPDPLKDLKNKTKQASKKVGNPAKEFAAKSEKVVKKVQAKAAPALNKAKKEVLNPAKEFAKKSQQANKKIGGPLAAIGFDTEGLQKDVLFGIGEKKVQKAVQKADDAADTAKQGAETVAKKVDENTPDSFSIFDQDSVKEATQKLKQNVDEYVSRDRDPAERVASVGKPGESQEENAERIRRESENNATAGGDARAPTGRSSPGNSAESAN